MVPLMIETSLVAGSNKLAFYPPRTKGMNNFITTNITNVLNSISERVFPRHSIANGVSWRKKEIYNQLGGMLI